MEKVIPFINRGGAAFRGMRCVAVAGKVKYKEGRWVQIYTLKFQACASNTLRLVLNTVAGSLKSAPLDDVDVRLGFYPVGGDTFTTRATVGICITADQPSMLELSAKIERPWNKDGDYEMDLATFAGWLESVGPVILRPPFVDETVDMFEDGIIPPLTVHDTHADPYETSAVGDVLMDMLMPLVEPSVNDDLFGRLMPAGVESMTVCCQGRSVRFERESEVAP